MSIRAWYDVWCDVFGCTDWTHGGLTKAEAAEHARQEGWKRERDGWKCPFHAKPDKRTTKP